MDNIEKIAFFYKYMEFVDRFNYLDFAISEEITQVFNDFMELEFKNYINFLEDNFINNNIFEYGENVTIYQDILLTMKKYTK